MNDLSVFLRPGKELFLSGPDFIQLIRETLHRGASLKFRARGFSMSPFIRDGDVITISPLGDSSIRRGEIAAFADHSRKKLFIHRVIHRNDGGELCLAGDNLPGPDAAVSAEQILGRVTRVERKGKKITFGLGKERVIIAMLTRHGLIHSFIAPMTRRLRSFSMIFHHG